MEKYCPTCFNKFPAANRDCPRDGTPLVLLSERDLVGEVLDKRYKVLGKVGRGGMGVVYRAEQLLIRRVVALKVLRREVVQDETSVRRFLTEARAISSLKSPHTVTLYDFGVTTDGLLYYTMELLEGQSLAKLIKQAGALPYHRAVDIIVQCCDSLEEAHEQGILHRDLKPDNIFLLDVRGRETAKVLDFGIAKVLGDNATESLTATGVICGTPAYLSPEQACGDPAVPASDLYSLGIVLYEMLAGQPPFAGATPLKVLHKHLTAQPVPVSVMNPSVQVPRTLDLFLVKALAKDVAERFRSVREFREALSTAVRTHDASPETVDLVSMETAAAGTRSITVRCNGDRAERQPLSHAAAPSEPPDLVPGPSTRMAVSGRSWVLPAAVVGCLALLSTFFLLVWHPWQGSGEGGPKQGVAVQVPVERPTPAAAERAPSDAAEPAPGTSLAEPAPAPTAGEPAPAPIVMEALPAASPVDPGPASAGTPTEIVGRPWPVTEKALATASPETPTTAEPVAQPTAEPVGDPSADLEERAGQGQGQALLGTAAEKSAWTAVGKPVEEPVGKPVVKSAEGPAEKPAREPVEQRVSRPAEKPEDKPAEKPVDKPAGKPVVKSAEGPSEKPTEKPVVNRADRPAEPEGFDEFKSLERLPEQP